MAVGGGREMATSDHDYSHDDHPSTVSTPSSSPPPPPPSSSGAKLIFTGTGSAVPCKHRNVTGIYGTETSDSARERLRVNLGVSYFVTVPVMHCQNSYGVVLDTGGGGLVVGVTRLVGSCTLETAVFPRASLT